jgi:hypothetical protein
MAVTYTDVSANFPIRVYTVTAVDLASVGANTTAEQDITVTGVTTADTLLSVIKPTASAGIGIVGARIKAANTIALTFVNATGSAVNADAEDGYQFIVIKAAP